MSWIRLQPHERRREGEEASDLEGGEPEAVCPPSVAPRFAAAREHVHASPDFGIADDVSVLPTVGSAGTGGAAPIPLG